MTSSVLVCWHAQRAGADVLRNAIADLKRQHRVAIHRVVYLVDSRSEVALPSIERVHVESVPVVIDDPTRHRRVYDAVRAVVQERLREAVHVNVSPGTPAMHAVWLTLFFAGALPAGSRLWSSQLLADKSTRIDPVDFELSTYLREIRHRRAAAPDVAHYELEAASPARRAALERLSRYARLPGAPLLVVGERGTGKSRLVEHTVQHLKQRRVTTVACGALDSTLAESLLFGHCKGAFTGATKDRSGLLQESDKGVLFLDEVQDLPSAVQRRLVRFLQDRLGRFRPVGGDAEIEVDVEVVCASNLSLADLRGRLDADLFDRISHLIVEVPPLRQCREDLALDWARVWREMRRDAAAMAEAPRLEEIDDLLKTHDLPGNLRDLQRRCPVGC